jgi:hypothetical protein
MWGFAGDRRNYQERNGVSHQYAKCPRCGHYFFYRGARSGGIRDTRSEKLNLLLGGGYHNAFSNKCLNCGLNIKGEQNI